MASSSAQARTESVARQQLVLRPPAAPFACPRCRAFRHRYDPDEPHLAAYVCGTTSMMILEGYHIEARSIAEWHRQRRAWRRRCARRGIEDPMM